jgi:hypothetical protein
MKPADQTTSSSTIIVIESENVKLFVNKKLLEDKLESLETIISAEVEKRAYGLSPQQSDEIKQNVRIKLWHALEARLILHPPAYIRAIVQSVFIDLNRGRRPPESLSLDDYDEINRGRVLINQSEGWGNPEYVAEQRENVANRLVLAIQAILKLPQRQKLSMIYLLLDRVDDIEQLKEVFERFQIPFDIADWPKDKVNTQRLRALIYVARRKIADFLNADVPVF